jgi:hypothetical protein
LHLVHWKRKDGQTINFGEWEGTKLKINVKFIIIIQFVSISANIVENTVINFTKINRVHMGTYLCTADNGIPPSAVYEIPIEVHCKY